MESEKIRVIQEQKVPTSLIELRSFLGLEIYYHKFIKVYSTHTTLLTKVITKDRPWGQSDEWQRAFNDLKQQVAKDPILELPDLQKLFEVHTNASDFAFGEVLVQKDHPVAFEIRKLFEA